MANVFTIKRGNQRPYLKAQLVRLTDDGEVEGPADLTAADSITFTMKNKTTGVVVIEKGADVSILGDPTLGNVQYEWQTGETDVNFGNYLGEFDVLYGAEEETFPNDKSGFPIKITDRLS
jgi:hypothetical protein